MSILIVIVVILSCAIGILLYIVLEKNETTPIIPNSDFDLNKNLILDPGFEATENDTSLSVWLPIGVYTLLTPYGFTIDNETIYPHNGSYSLSLNVTDFTDVKMVTQTISIDLNPKSLNFSGWANGDLFTPVLQKDEFVPFLITLELEFIDLSSSVYTVLFDTDIKGWQFGDIYIDQIPQPIVAIRVSCGISKGVGYVFFDDLSLYTEL